jgi:hypothetical protein
MNSGKTFWIWLAGFWEGEGSLNRSIGIRITQKNPIPLWKIQQVAGGVVAKEIMGGGQRYWRWRVTSDSEVRAILTKIRPFLTFRLMEVNSYLFDRPKRKYNRHRIVRTML